MLFRARRLYYFKVSMRPSLIYSRPRLRFLVILSCLGAASICLFAADAAAQIALDVLRRDGYGMVPITRPQPNDLIVHAIVNGRNISLVLDTGWGADGISLDSDYSGSLRLKTEAVQGQGESATGRKVTVTKGTAETVVLGNVQIKGVPLFFGTFAALRNQQVRQSVGAGGFVGAGFLRINSAIIDLQNLRLYLRPPGKGRRVLLGPALKAVGLSEVPFTSDGHGHFLVDVEINGATGKMIIDTGATLTSTDARFASQMKAIGYNSGLSAIDAAGVISETALTRARSFKIGGVAVRAPAITLAKFSSYSSSGGKVIGVLGMDILGQNWSIIDFGQQKLYLVEAQ